MEATKRPEIQHDLKFVELIPVNVCDRIEMVLQDRLLRTKEKEQRDHRHRYCQKKRSAWGFFLKKKEENNYSTNRASSSF